MTKPAGSKPKKREAHVVVWCAIKVALAVTRSIVGRATCRKDLEEESFVATLTSDRGLVHVANRTVQQELSDTGYDDIEVKVTSFSGKGTDDCSIWFEVNGERVEFPLNLKLEKESGGFKRVSRRRATLARTAGTTLAKGRPVDQQLILGLSGSQCAYGWGVLAIICPAGAYHPGDVEIYAYDGPALLATVDEFNGLGGALSVPGFKAEHHPAVLAMYGSEDGLLQADHSLAHQYWDALAPKLLGSRAPSREELARTAVTRYQRAHRKYLEAALEENRKGLEVLAEYDELSGALQR